jgi:beta-lactamase regulating signal transducer with metallopeptidase domain
MNIDLSPAALCLVGSLVSAPLVYAVAARIARPRAPNSGELVWLAALGFVALPALLAPSLAALGISLRPPPIIEISSAAPAAAPLAETPAAPAAAPAGAASPGPRMSVETLISAAALLYVYGVLLAVGLKSVRALLFAAHVGSARAIDHPRLARATEDWKRRLGLRRDIELRTSDAVSSVCVYGFRRPVVLVPSDLGARISFDDLALMIAHELAHVRRGDGALFAVCEAARVLFWFNPFVKRMADRAELAAEQNADALVLAAGADRRRYAACFVEGLKFAAERTHAARLAVPAFTPFDRKGRRDRLDAILSGGARVARRSRAAIGSAAILAGVLAFAQAALAVAPEPIVKERDPLAAHGAARLVEDENAIVRAPADGVVIEATDVYKGKPSWGKVVVIGHGAGKTSRFAKLDSYSVKKGERVRAGEPIGRGAGGADVMILLADVKAKDAPQPKPPKAPAPFVPAEPASPTTPVAPVEPLPPSPPAGEIDSLDTALSGRRAEGESLLRIEVNADVSIKSADGWFECGEDGAECEFVVPENSTHLLIARGEDAGRLIWDGCAPSANARSCEIVVGDEPASVAVRDSRDAGADDVKDRHARFHGDGDFFFKNDDGSFAFAFGAPMSDEDKERFRQSMADVRETLRRARANHAHAMSEMGAAFKSFRFDSKEIEEIRKKASEQAKAFVEDWSSSWDDGAGCDEACRDEAIEDAMRERERALEDAAREREEAAHERERALEEAAREREEAAREREEALRVTEIERANALAEAMAEAETARAEAAAERAEIEAEIAERAEALAEAERDLAEERAELERLRQELASRR